ncbi:carboxypeptidase [Shewanella mangrovi]|uniref:Carboxypeptidase n=1 Tax=Shewanella mangrovi TaxID=1515746 RepID=A0A094JD91_9GAMM|nr:carboxypeptidase [Shewanella mangrovi]KFZ37212.1 carboxypeptidase [Shewanella mangrovi]
MRNIVILMVTMVLSFGAYAAEDKKPSETPSVKPEAKVSVTEHSVRIDGKKIEYVATAGTMLMKNEKGEPKALFGFTAYVKKDTDLRTRPIMFAYNGGPGSASLWLHMGILGPQRTEVIDTEFSDNGPFKRVNNEYSILDKADLVMIDPVGTGLSHAVGEAKNEDFWGTDQDIESVAAFIKQYITENKRWQSPKYILGESYGGMRTAGVAQYLVSNDMIALKGIILVSPFLQLITGFDFGQADLPHILFMPSFAATAWYHDAIPNKPKELQTFIQQAEKFTVEEYAPALMKGASISAADKQMMANKLASFTGVSADYWMLSNLRVDHQAFLKELLKSKQMTVGRIDSRFKGYSLEPIADHTVYDPMTTAVGPQVLATFMDYYATDLGVKDATDYVVFGNVFSKWDFGHKQPNFSGFKMPFPDTGVDLSYAMIQSPKMKVLVQQGYFDMATPFFTTKYMLDHLKIPAELRANIHTEYYMAGHMMYVHPASMAKFKQDLAAFIE